MARAEVLQRFGEPNRMQAIIKSDEAIWGAIEEFWSQVPMGSTVEIWSYHVEGGSVELYFVDESPVVEGTGFAPEGVVFETSGAEDG